MSGPLPERPALRPGIQPVRVQHADLPQDLELFALKDPFRLSQEQLLLPVPLLALASLCDGTRTVAELQRDFAQEYGPELPLERIEELVEALERTLLLSGPALAEAERAFRADPDRPPACIGSYPGDPAELRTFLSAQWTRAGGPGGPPAERAGAPPIRALISPHIDLHRGGHTYAWTWRAVAEDCPADLFVIFGTSHTGTEPLDASDDAPSPRFALTKKTFHTPLGPVPTDVEVVERLLAAYAGPDDLLAGEMHHKGEHSIEFQAVYLAHLFAGRRPIRILPVLCGSLRELAGPPSEDPALLAFHAALRAALAGVPPERVAFVAAIDLAHVGADFGQKPVGEADLRWVEDADRRTLRLCLEARDPDRVHSDVMHGNDPRNVCGHAPLVALCQALGDRPLAGELLRYDRWHDGASAVSFAAGVFREETTP